VQPDKTNSSVKSFQSHSKKELTIGIDRCI